MKYMLILTFSILTLTSGLSPQAADAEEAKKSIYLPSGEV